MWTYSDFFWQGFLWDIFNFFDNGRRCVVCTCTVLDLKTNYVFEAKAAFWMFDRMCLFYDGSQRPCFLPNNKQPHLMHTDRDLNTGFFIALRHPSIPEIGFFWCLQKCTQFDVPNILWQIRNFMHHLLEGKKTTLCNLLSRWLFKKSK